LPFSFLVRACMTSGWRARAIGLQWFVAGGDLLPEGTRLHAVRRAFSGGFWDGRTRPGSL